MFSPRHMTQFTAAALVAGAVAAPTASAMSIAGSPTRAPSRPAPAVATYSPQDKQLTGNVAPGVAAGLAASTLPRASNPTGDFDWGDAAIGAGSGVALSMLGIGGALALQRRSRKPAARQGASAIATS